MNDIEKILKAALSPTKYPSEALNNKLMNKMKESGDMRLKHKNYMVAAIIIICLLVIPTSAYAAYKYLLPKEAAGVMEDEKLGEAFKKNGTEVLQTVEDGSYKVTFLGHVTGKSISQRTGSAWELHPDRIYVAVAIEKSDGSDMKDEDNQKIFVSPLIQGLRPWSYNIASMNGSYMGKVIDGVLYRIIECDNIEIFADKKLYLAVSDTSFYSIEAFQYDAQTGYITVNDTFKGTNILFDLKLDSKKADPVKANEYLKQLEEEWNPNSKTKSETKDETKSETKSETKDETKSETESETKSKESTQEDKITSDKTSVENPRVQKKLYADEDNKIKIHIKDNDSHRWSAGEELSQTVFHFYCKVDGKNIESLTYTLKKGEFCSYPLHSLSEVKYYGKKYSMNYDEQKDSEYLYNIIFRAKYTDYGYDVDKIRKIGYKDLEARDKIYYDALNKEIKATKMNLDIKMKDGRTIQKTLTFHNVLDEKLGAFWIAISVE